MYCAGNSLQKMGIKRRVLSCRKSSQRDMDGKQLGLEKRGTGKWLWSYLS